MHHAAETLERSQMLKLLSQQDEEETLIGHLPCPTNPDRVLMLHATGNVYTLDPDGRCRVLARMKVETDGLELCISAARAAFEPARKCDSPGCAARALMPTSVAPGTQIRPCRSCFLATAQKEPDPPAQRGNPPPSPTQN